MQTRKQKIEEILSKEFTPSFLNVVDFSEQHAGHAEAVRSGGGHFSVEISSEKLNDLSRVESHRMVKGTLTELFEQNEIHALTIKVSRT